MPVPRLTVTPAALKFVRRMVRFSGLPAGGFRLSVRPGGCSGLAAEFSVEATPQAGDAELALEDGTRLFLPAPSCLLLDGVTMDFADAPTACGLIFVGSKQQACGCGAAGDSPPGQATVSVHSIRRVTKA